MRLTRLRLNGSTQLIPGSVIDVHLPAANTVVIHGGNSSGKSLITTALSALFGPPEQRDGLTEALAAAGATLLQVELSQESWSAQAALDFTNGDRQIIWVKRTAGWSSIAMAAAGPDREAEPGLATVLQPHLVMSGRLALTLDGALWDQLRLIVRAPSERELATWTARLVALTGETGSEGKLAGCLLAVTSAEQRLRHVEALQSELDRERNRQNEQTLHLADLIATGEMLKAEHEELRKICQLADRAQRVHTWIEEIRESVRTIEEARERALQLHASLHHLERKFASVPPNLPDLVQGYVAARDLERELRSQLDVIENDRRLAHSAVETATHELAALKVPDVRQQEAEERNLRTEIEQIDERLIALQRGRIELIRQQDGLANQIAHDFADLAPLNEDQRLHLLQYVDLKLSSTAQAALADAVAADDERRRDTRRREIKAGLVRDFAGYDRLPPTTPDLLGELSDRRRILATLNADAEQLAKRRELATATIKPTVRITWAVAVAAIGFAIGTAAAGWDIGLFAAVIASGLTLVARKFLHRDAESKLDSIVGAQAMSEARLKETRDRIARLEELLSPLAGFGHLDEALTKYQGYLTAVAELAELDRPDGEIELRKVRAFQKQLAELEQRLPAAVTAMEPRQVRGSLEQLQELQLRYAQLHDALREYSEGGTHGVEIVELEARLAALKTSLAATQAYIAEQTAEYEALRAALTARIRDLEQSAMQQSSVRRITDELAVVEKRLDQLTAASGELLATGDPESLNLEWNALASQRDEIKRLDAEISRLPALDELRAREALLAEEFDDVRARLAQLEPLYLLQGSVADYAAKYARQLKTAAESIDVNDVAIGATQDELQKLGVEQVAAALAAEPSLDSLRFELAERRSELDSVQREVQTAQGLADTVRTELAELDRRFVSELQQLISARIAQLTDGAFAGATLTSGELNLVLPDGSTRNVARLSDGVADLVWCAVRLALLERLHGVEDAPVIWDEPFARIDERRITRLREAIQRIAAGRQVVLLTRDSRLQSWGATTMLDDRAEQPVPVTAQV
ncbi:hypothetical protein HZB60_02030 [candidate division KSB1 bacterium]|nr:hypothetical protein [candidate division KSB1 bacterium]